MLENRHTEEKFRWVGICRQQCKQSTLAFVALISATKMTKRRLQPSAHDVARLAGVSQAAVSRAFTPGASVAKATQDKIFHAANSINYRPNRIARSLIKGESGMVGVVMGNRRNWLFMSALDSISERLSQEGKHIIVNTGEDTSIVDKHVSELLMYRIDALLLMAANLSPKLAEQCRAEGIPVIALHQRPPDGKYLASVTANNREGAQQIAAHLIQQGYRRIGLITGHVDSLTSLERALRQAWRIPRSTSTSPARSFVSPV